MSQQTDVRSFKSGSFTHPSAKKPWRFLVLDADDEIPQNRWYQRRNWKSRNCVRYESTWPEDWETYSEEEMVSGVAERNRIASFFLFSRKIGLSHLPRAGPDA